MTPLHFTITNDDGFEAAGLAVLAQVARRFGTADIVAPLTVQSQTSHAVSLGRPLAVRVVEHAALGRVWTVAGRPADCTRLALAGIAGERRPDWVLSGINHGANLGADLHYSGTVAAAREAAFQGVAGAAFSQLVRRPRPIDWEGAAIMAEHALRRLLESDCPSGAYLNVNLPAVDGGFERVAIVEAPVDSRPLPLAYAPSDPPPGEGGGADGTRYVRYSAAYHERPRTPGSDADMVFAGHICCSRLSAGG